MRIRRNRTRKQRPHGRRVDTSAMREILFDTRSWLHVGIVVKDGDTHFEQDGKDVIVFVELMPSEMLIACRLANFGGGAGQGIYRVPAVGSEVAVGIPGGDPECGGIVLGTLSTAQVPDGVAESRIVVVAPEVLVYDSDDAEAKELAYKSDVQRIRDELHLHTHTVICNTDTPTTAVTTSTGPAVTSPDGTEVLKGK